MLLMKTKLSICQWTHQPNKYTNHPYSGSAHMSHGHSFKAVVPDLFECQGVTALHPLRIWWKPDTISLDKNKNSHLTAVLGIIPFLTTTPSKLGLLMSPLSYGSWHEATSSSQFMVTPPFQLLRPTHRSHLRLLSLSGPHIPFIRNPINSTFHSRIWLLAWATHHCCLDYCNSFPEDLLASLWPFKSILNNQ